MLNNHNMPEETDQQKENLEQYYKDAKTDISRCNITQRIFKNEINQPI